MAVTVNLGITLLEAGQVNPEVTVNEALRIIDALIPYPIIENVGDSDPDSPTDPLVPYGVYYVDGTGLNGWAGHDAELAINLGTQDDPTWFFIPTNKSCLGYVKKDGATAVNRLRIRTDVTSDTWSNF